MRRRIALLVAATAAAFAGAGTLAAAAAAHAAPPSVPVASAAPIYAAAWLTNDSHALLSSTFSQPTLPCPLIRSDTIVDGASFPIALPAVLPLSGLSNAMWGQAQRIKLLAFVRDERVQTMLLSQSLPPNASSTISLQRSQHSYPSVVLAHTNSSSDAASASRIEVQGRLMDADSYAEALWARLEAAGMITVTRDNGSLALQTLGAITSVTLTAADAGASATSFTTLLPATRFFPATTATIQILNGTAPQNNLDAFTCVESSLAPDGLSCIGAGTAADPTELLRGFFLPASVASLRSAIVDPCVHEFDVVPFSDHTTLEFMPADPSVYYPYLSRVQNYSVLAYARDEHVSAVLLTLTGPLGNADGHSLAVYSLNSYSHTTVTAMNAGGVYGAAYSNVLWTRIVNASILVVQRDEDGHITGAEFGPDVPLTAAWEATLPAFDDTQTLFTLYPPTNVYVELITPGSLNLQGVVCLSDVWDAGLRVCDASPAPFPAPGSGSGPRRDPLPKWAKILLGVVGGVGLAICMLCCCTFFYRRSHAGYKGPLDEQMHYGGQHAPATSSYQPPQYRPVNH